MSIVQFLFIQNWFSIHCNLRQKYVVTFEMLPKNVIISAVCAAAEVILIYFFFSYVHTHTYISSGVHLYIVSIYIYIIQQFLLKCRF